MKIPNELLGRWADDVESLTDSDSLGLHLERGNDG